MPAMATRSQRAERRTDALSKERIVEAAIEILDSSGENALTFRALMSRLATGSGAIYWHVANKNDLLAAATDALISRVMADVPVASDPADVIRATALGVFDVIDAHPWAGAQLAREPGQLAMVQILERIGSQVEALGVLPAAQFDAATVLAHYILGVAGQNAANARMHAPGMDRATFLAAVAARWAQLDPAEFPITHRAAAQLAGHDDRAQFLAGINLILAGILATR